MKTINGLMLKDLYIFKGYKKNIIFSIFTFILILALASLRMNILITGGILFLVVFGMNGISTFSYDEMAGAEKYLLTLPISRQELIIGKYLFTFLDSLISLIFGLLISLIITILIPKQIVNLGDSLKICFIAFTASSFLTCADIPCIYKWGVEKGRMQAVVVPVIIFFILGLISFIPIVIFPEFFLHLSLKGLFAASPFICLFLNIIFYTVSYFVSQKIFLTKDL